MFQEGDDLGVLFVDGFKDLAGKEIGGSGGGGRGLWFTRSEAEARVGLFATTG